jgi:type I restriction enzyme, S subunit
MNVELLLTHFDRISDAPDAIPRLRSFILDLAVLGKLVEQDTADEPAAKLIERIARRAPQLEISPKEIGTGLIDANEAPFKIPSNWIWVRLGDICSKTGSGSTPRGGRSVYQRSGVPFLRSQNVHNDGLHLDDVAYITPETHERMSGTAVEPGDLLLNITGGSIGRCCLVPSGLGQANVSQHVAIIRTAIAGTQGYLRQLALSPYFQSFVISEQTGAGRGGLPKNRMDRIPVALPPLSEQFRIVARVAELMKLCDQLEVQHAERQVCRDRLVAASLHHLNNGADEEAFRGHARFYLNHLSQLVSEPLQIPSLRQTVINLAARGRLVPQDPNEQPASEILKQVHAERARLLAAGEEKKQKQVRSTPPDDVPFDVPKGWLWVSLGQLAFGFRYGTSVKCSYASEGVPVLRIPNVDNGRITLEDLKFGPLSKREADDLRLRLGDILVVRSNGSLDLVGLPALVEANAVGYCYAGYLVRVRTSHTYLDTRYLLIALNATVTRNQIEIPIRTTVGLKNLNATELSSIAIPLPPLAEQRRIVAKVDELTALCDDLERQLAVIHNGNHRLLEAVLHQSLSDSVPIQPPSAQTA